MVAGGGLSADLRSFLSSRPVPLGTVRHVAEVHIGNGKCLYLLPGKTETERGCEFENLLAIYLWGHILHC